MTEADNVIPGQEKDDYPLKGDEKQHKISGQEQEEVALEKDTSEEIREETPEKEEQKVAEEEKLAENGDEDDIVSDKDTPVETDSDSAAAADNENIRKALNKPIHEMTIDEKASYLKRSIERVERRMLDHQAAVKKLQEQIEKLSSKLADLEFKANSKANSHGGAYTRKSNASVQTDSEEEDK